MCFLLLYFSVYFPYFHCPVVSVVLKRSFCASRAMPSSLQAIQDFVEKARATGASQKEIKEILIEQGWPKNLVSRVLGQGKSAKSSVQPLILIENVTKSFEKDIVLNCINLQIFPQEIFAVIGVSGCGKTTLLNSIVGFVQPDEGRVQLNMEAEPSYQVDVLFRNPNAFKRLFGFSTQAPSFYENLTVEENIEHFGSLYGLLTDDIQRNKNSLLKLLGLEDCSDHIAGTLSRGMQKRLDIACALIHDPKILILDEPTANLDPFLRNEMWSLVKEINKKGTTVIIASHFLSELESFCDRIAVLHNHTVVAVGTPLELKKHYTTNYEIHFQISSHKYKPLIDKLKKHKNLKIVKESVQENKAILYTPVPHETLQSLLTIIKRSKETLMDIDVNRPTIREIFETMLKK